MAETLRVEIRPAMSRAINRTGDMVATAIGRELASETGLPIGEVRDELEISHSTPADLEYTITVPGRHLTLQRFAPREVKRGISARPWRRRRTFPYAFMVRDIPFIREGEERFPIRPLFGPSLGVEVGRGNTEEVARRIATDVLLRRVMHEISRIVPTKGGALDSD